MLTVYANKYLHNIDQARDIVQDVFVRLYEKRKSITIETSIKSYLFKSVYNSCINYIRINNIHNKHLLNIKKGKENDYVDLIEEMQTSELEKFLYDAISELPEQCKKIFKMNRFNGMKNAEIAEKLKLSKRTVETQISKALKILREKLSHYRELNNILKMEIT
jgi:RNA polymerase sigma-70 factor (ECF subfamily)